MDYVEGMMIDAHVQLCLATKQQSYCDQAESIAQASLNVFPELHPWMPEPDTIYLKGMLDLYAVDGNPTWYALAYANAHDREAERARRRRPLDEGLVGRLGATRASSYAPAATLELVRVDGGRRRTPAS